MPANWLTIKGKKFIFLFFWVVKTTPIRANVNHNFVGNEKRYRLIDIFKKIPFDYDAGPFFLKN